MIDDESEPGSWKQAVEWMNQVKSNASMTDRADAEEDQPMAESSDEVEVLMEKCRQWKQSTEMLCAIRSDHITLGDLYRAGIAVSLSIDE